MFLNQQKSRIKFQHYEKIFNATTSNSRRFVKSWFHTLLLVSRDSFEKSCSPKDLRDTHQRESRQLKLKRKARSIKEITSKILLFVSTLFDAIPTAKSVAKRLWKTVFLKPPLDTKRV